MDICAHTHARAQNKGVSERGVDDKFFRYLTGGVYVLSFRLARLITFADMNYAAMYPMCVP